MEGGKEDDIDNFDADDIDQFMQQQTKIEKESCMNLAAFVEQDVKADEDCK